jgi:hypothetical protein
VRRDRRDEKPIDVRREIGPPAEKLYAVEPVGVATMTASAAYRTNGKPCTAISTAAMLRQAPAPRRCR